MTKPAHYDVIVIGSGFGGSVSALRLAEKGYRVAVLEAGARFEDQDFAKTSWRLHKFLYFPRLGLRGIQRVHFLKDVVVLAGAGVGGGSLNYANTLYQPPSTYFQDEHWAHITDWEAELAPHYDQAKRMLGVVDNPFHSPSDDVIRRVAERLQVGNTFRLTPVGVHFGEGPGVVSPDPFFGGVGPERKGCTNCGECMTGCRHNAKNTLLKNYLGLAERAGVEVIPLTTVTSLEPADGSGPWRVNTRSSASWLPSRRVFTCDQVIVAAGTFNTQRLLHRMKDTGRLPKLSGYLGVKSRTNSEALVGAVGKNGQGHEFHKGSAITSSIHLDEHTHVEPVRYGIGSNAMALLATLLSDGATPAERRRNWLSTAARRPLALIRLLNARGWSQRTIIALVMQNLDSSIHVSGRRGLFGWRLRSKPDAHRPNPKSIPQANLAAREIAKEMDGEPMGALTDLFGAPITAHFVGGCVIGDSPNNGVIDPYHRVWGYPTLHVVDGSAVTANLGVNPSLTITAQAERALALWPNRGEADLRPAQGEQYRRLNPVKPVNPVVPSHAPAALRNDSPAQTAG